MENKAAFATLMLDASLESYHKMTSGSRRFFEYFSTEEYRDTYCYMELENIPVLLETEQIILRKSLPYKCLYSFRHGKVFTKQITERKQSWQEAVNTYEIMRDIYIRYGYNIINVPFGYNY